MRSCTRPRPDVRERLKLEGGKRFVMETEFKPAGDQPTAIAELTQGVHDGDQDQVSAWARLVRAKPTPWPR